MKKQRICIVGDGLSGLMTALALNKLEGLEVHLISKKNKLLKDKRTTAISASNYDFFNSVVDNLDKKLFWPSNKINLFYETKDQNINFLNFDEDKKGLMYIFENDKVKEKLHKALIETQYINASNRVIAFSFYVEKTVEEDIESIKEKIDFSSCDTSSPDDIEKQFQKTFYCI